MRAFLNKAQAQHQELSALTRREANIATAIIDLCAAPVARLPKVQETDAVASFDHAIKVSPPMMKFGLRAMLYLCELGPRFFGFSHRFRQLPLTEKTTFFQRLFELPFVAPIVRDLYGLMRFFYYGNDTVMHRLGYEPDEVVKNAQALREEEGRW